jgi:hypothetical protein
MHDGKHLFALEDLFIAGDGRCATARAPNRVDFIEKDDARRILLGLLKQIVHAAGPEPDEQFDEVSATGAIEDESCFG